MLLRAIAAIVSCSGVKIKFSNPCLTLYSAALVLPLSPWSEALKRQLKVEGNKHLRINDLDFDENVLSISRVDRFNDSGDQSALGRHSAAIIGRSTIKDHLKDLFF